MKTAVLRLASLRSRPATVFALAVSLLAMTGCTSIGLEPPDLTLVNLQLEEVTVLESSGLVTLRIANSNPDPLVVDGLAINLKLDGRRIGKVLSAERLEIPRLSTATLEGELHVNHLAVLTLVQQILESEGVTYGLSGKVYVQTELGRRSLRIERAGRFEFEGGEDLLDGSSDSLEEDPL